MFSSAQTSLSNGVQNQSTSGHIASITSIAKLTKMIIVALVIIAGMLTFDFLILWITSGKFLERLPL